MSIPNPVPAWCTGRRRRPEWTATTPKCRVRTIGAPFPTAWPASCRGWRSEWASPTQRRSHTAGAGSGRCIATTAWQSEEAMRASAEAVRPIRDRVAEILGGSPTVEEWEIAALHRDHQSRDRACVRATWVKIDPDQIDRGIDFYKATILPALEEFEGFCSASLLVDRASGRGVSLATYDSVEAMDRNKEQLDSSEPGHRGSTRRGARGARFRVGDRPPACA